MELYKFKITLPSGELRRLRFQTAPTWPEFLDSIYSILLVGRKPEEFVIQYQDEEGDAISVFSEIEWSEALDILKKDNIKKFKIVPKDQLPKTSSSSPEEKLTQQPIETVVKQILEQVCVHADSFVNQIPSFIDTVVEEVKKFQQTHIPSEKLEQPSQPSVPQFVPNVHSTFMGMKHCPRRFRNPLVASPEAESRAPRMGCRRFKNPHRMNRRAFGHLFDHNYAAARDCFLEMTRLNPNDSIAFYNLACTYSLLSSTELGGDPQVKEQNIQAALQSLAQAIALGYRKIDHIDKDSDFDPIRSLPAFQELLLPLRGTPTSEAEKPIVEDPTPAPAPQEEEPLPPQPIALSIQVPEPVQESKPVQEPQPISASSELENLQRQVDDFVFITQNQAPVQEEPVQENTNQFEHVVFKQFEDEIKQLNEMGFFDNDKNLDLLLINNGDLFQVISQLL